MIRPGRAATRRDAAPVGPSPSTHTTPFGAGRSHTDDGAAPRRILAVRSDSVGDVLLTGPAVRALAAVAPVTMLAGPIGASAAALLPGVDEVLVHRCAWIDATRPPVDSAAIDELVAALRSRPIDLAVVFTSSRQSPLPMALLLRLAGVPRIVARSIDSPGSMVDVCLRSDEDQHEVERNLALVAAAGIDLPDDRRLRVDPAPSANADPAVAALPSVPFVVVHPGSSVPARTMTADRWTAVVRGLRAAGRAVVLTGTDDDHVTAQVRRAVRDETADASGAPDAALVDLVGRTELGVLAEVVRRASAICVGNTGPMHLAAAVGTPVVATFAPTVPVVRWRPWMVPHVLVGDHGVPCAHCHLRVCAMPEQICLSVDPGEVVAAVLALADGPRSSPATSRIDVRLGEPIEARAEMERCA